jgi:hypothetical protein
MSAWLIGVLVILAAAAVGWLLMEAGAKWVKSTCAQWEEDQVRRIAASLPCTCHPDEAPVPCQHKYAFSECERAARIAADAGPTEIDPDRFDAAVRTQDLPANWREQDGAGSFHDAWAEIRRRKTGGA